MGQLYKFRGWLWDIPMEVKYNLKDLQIRVIIDNERSKVITAIKTKYFDRDNISHQFELLGILQNLVELQKQKIKILGGD